MRRPVEVLGLDHIYLTVLVSRTPYRDDVVKYRDAFAVFLNPLADLLSRKK